MSVYVDLGITVVVTILTLLRIVIMRGICLNSSRVLHNK